MDLCHSLEPHLPKDKVVLVGNPGVGKSTIYHRFKTGRFVEVEEFGSAHHVHEKEFWKEWTVEDTRVTMTLFDTAGVERYTQTIPRTYFRKAKAVVMVYSIDNNDSFTAISTNWLDNARVAGENAIKVLVGNKLDLSNDEECEGIIPKQRAETLADNFDIDLNMVFEVSALTGKGIQEMFDAVALQMVQMEETPPPFSPQSSVKVENEDNDKCWISKC